MKRSTMVIIAGCTALVALGTQFGAVAENRAPIESVGFGEALLGVISESVEFETSSTAWVDVPRANLQVFVPDIWAPGVIFARFSASAACVAPAGEHCSARIVFDGVEGNPAGGTAVVFTESANFQALTLERWMGNLNNGKRDVRVQVAVTDPTATLTLTHWSLYTEIMRQVFHSRGASP